MRFECQELKKIQLDSFFKFNFMNTQLFLCNGFLANIYAIFAIISRAENLCMKFSLQKL